MSHPRNAEIDIVYINKYSQILTTSDLTYIKLWDSRPLSLKCLILCLIPC